MKRAFVAGALVLAAQFNPYHSARASDNASVYCAVGSVKLMIDSKPETVEQTYTTCRPGDLISIPGNSVDVVARICDFTKQIYHAPNGAALCVMGLLKPLVRK